MAMDPPGVRTAEITGPMITLSALLKWTGAAQTGGAGKLLIQQGHVRVNGVLETRRRRQLGEGDLVEIAGMGSWRVRVGGARN